MPRSLDTVRVVLAVLKSSIFVVQKLALHQNGVEFCQQSIGNIRISPATHVPHVPHVHTIPCIEATRCLKNRVLHLASWSGLIMVV